MYSTQGEQLKDWGVIRVALIKKYGIMWEFSPNVVDDFVKMLVFPPNNPVFVLGVRPLGTLAFPRGEKELKNKRHWFKKVKDGKWTQQTNNMVYLCIIILKWTKKLTC